MTGDDLKRIQNTFIEGSKAIIRETELRMTGFVITLHKNVDKLFESGWGVEFLDPKETIRDVHDDNVALLIVDLTMNWKRLYHAVMNIFPKAREILPAMIALGQSLAIDNDAAYKHTMRAFLRATELDVKDISAATVRQICEKTDAFACIFHSEAWVRMVDPNDKAAIEEAQRSGLAKDTKAVEVLLSVMETHNFTRSLTIPIVREPSNDPKKRDGGKVLGFGEPDRNRQYRWAHVGLPQAAGGCVVSRGEEKQAQLAALVDAILVTGTSMPALIDMFAAVLRLNGLAHEADQISAIAHGEPSPDVAQIMGWFEAQATKERELLDSDQCNNPTLAQERWMIYKASAMSVREGAWKP